MGIDIFLFIDLQNIHFIKIEYTLYKNIQKNICTHFTDLVISLSLFIHLQNVHFIKIECTLYKNRIYKKTFAQTLQIW